MDPSENAAGPEMPPAESAQDYISALRQEPGSRQRGANVGPQSIKAKWMASAWTEAVALQKTPPRRRSQLPHPSAYFNAIEAC